MSNNRIQGSLDYALRKNLRRKPRKPVKPACVYVVTCGEFVKIGIASNPQARLIELQVGCPLPLTLQKITRFDDAGHAEDVLHERFNQFRVRGEWFKLPPAELAILFDLLDGL